MGGGAPLFSWRVRPILLFSVKSLSICGALSSNQQGHWKMFFGGSLSASWAPPHKREIQGWFSRWMNKQTKKTMWIVCKPVREWEPYPEFLSGTWWKNQNSSCCLQLGNTIPPPPPTRLRAVAKAETASKLTPLQRTFSASKQFSWSLREEGGLWGHLCGPHHRHQAADRSCHLSRERSSPDCLRRRPTWFGDWDSKFPECFSVWFHLSITTG